MSRAETARAFRQTDQVNISSPQHLRTEVLDSNREARSAQEAMHALETGREALSAQRRGVEQVLALAQQAASEPDGTEARRELAAQAAETAQALRRAPETAVVHRAASVLDGERGEAPAAPRAQLDLRGMDLDTPEGLDAGVKAARQALAQSSQLDRSLAAASEGFAQKAEAAQTASVPRDTEPLRAAGDARRVIEDVQRQLARPSVSPMAAAAQMSVSSAAANYLLRG